MTDRPLMNGADGRLERLEERIGEIALNFQRAEAELNPARIERGLQALREVNRELGELIGNVRDARTLAHSQNWRLRMQYDSRFYAEFLRLAEETVLVLAIREAEAGVVAKLLKALEKAGVGTGGE